MHSPRNLFSGTSTADKGAGLLFLIDSACDTTHKRFLTSTEIIEAAAPAPAAATPLGAAAVALKPAAAAAVLQQVLDSRTTLCWTSSDARIR